MAAPGFDEAHLTLVRRLYRGYHDHDRVPSVLKGAQALQPRGLADSEADVADGFRAEALF